MCKVNIKWGDTRIDPCMGDLIKRLKGILDKNYTIVACCCGHKKYKKTIMIHSKINNFNFEFFTGRVIPRTRRFYKRDEKGIYFIPEVQYG